VKPLSFSKSFASRYNGTNVKRDLKIFTKNSRRIARKLHVPHTRILTAAKSRIGELKEIHDKAEALRIYVRKAEKGLE
jgi:hypothetical protein